MCTNERCSPPSRLTWLFPLSAAVAHVHGGLQRRERAGPWESELLKDSWTAAQRGEEEECVKVKLFHMPRYHFVGALRLNVCRLNNDSVNEEQQNVRTGQQSLCVSSPRLIMTVILFFYETKLHHSLLLSPSVHPLSGGITDGRHVFDLVPSYSDICTFYLLYLLKYTIMCRDVKYIIQLLEELSTLTQKLLAQ